MVSGRFAVKSDYHKVYALPATASGDLHLVAHYLANECQLIDLSFDEFNLASHVGNRLVFDSMTSEADEELAAKKAAEENHQSRLKFHDRLII